MAAPERTFGNSSLRRPNIAASYAPLAGSCRRPAYFSIAPTRISHSKNFYFQTAPSPPTNVSSLNSLRTSSAYGMPRSLILLLVSTTPPSHRPFSWRTVTFSSENTARQEYQRRYFAPYGKASPSHYLRQRLSSRTREQLDDRPPLTTTCRRYVVLLPVLPLAPPDVRTTCWRRFPYPF